MGHSGSVNNLYTSLRDLCTQIVSLIQPKEEKKHAITMEQIKKATQHVTPSKVAKEVFEPTSAVDVS